MQPKASNRMYDTDFDRQKLMFHPEAVGHWLTCGQSRGPLYTEMELTRRCNCRCFFCGVDHQVNASDDRISVALAHRVINGLAELGNKSLMLCGNGEPLLHPEAEAIIAFAAERMSVSVTTNGGPLTAERLPLIDRLEWIRFSVNGGSPENYAAIHGTTLGAFDRVLANIAGAVARKRAMGLSVTIGTQLVLLPENAALVVDLARQLKEIGVDYFSVKPYSQHPLSHNHQLIDYHAYLALADALGPLADEQFNVIFRATAMTKAGRAKSYGKCYGTNFIAFVSANGDLWECNVFVGDPRFLIGNIADEPLPTLWHGPRRREIVTFIDQGLGLDHCRDLCRMDACNHYLWRLKHPWPHDNFI
jgi:radical SAM protein with 4Fe4S-binding SPASM domain